MLDYKFKPFWEPTVATLIAAVEFCSTADQESVWNLILHVLVQKSYQGPGEISQQDVSNQQSILFALDDGVKQIPITQSSSEYFHFKIDFNDQSRKHISDIKVELDARTDYNTSYITLWSVFRRCPKLTMQRSKIVVPIFLRYSLIIILILYN